MNIIILKYSQLPIYEQIQNQIKEQILKGKLKPGQQLPSIRLLAKELKVSIITVKRAYEELEHDGVITTIHGRGCFVIDIDLKMAKEINIKTLSDKLLEIKQFAQSRGISKEEVIKLYESIIDGGR